MKNSIVMSDDETIFHNLDENPYEGIIDVKEPRFSVWSNSIILEYIRNEEWDEIEEIPSIDYHNPVEEIIEELEQHKDYPGIAKAIEILKS